MRAIITGCAGQDGSYLTELLIGKNYDVYGIYKRNSRNNDLSNLKTVLDHPRLHLLEMDICDHATIAALIADVQPDEFYNLAAQSHVGYSFKNPVETFRIDAEAVIGILHSIQKLSPHTKFYQASTSELYGGLVCPESGYDESSSFHPRSPYAIAKLAAFNSVVNAREAYGTFACNGILFNHSSPRRGKDFATAKIAAGVAKIVTGKETKLQMGNLEAIRDEGHSYDYVRAMHLIMQQDKPEDFVVATGQAASIREMLEYVCSLAGLKLEDVYVQDARFMRPSDVPKLLGNPAKIMRAGFEFKYAWRDVLKDMFNEELKKETGDK